MSTPQELGKKLKSYRSDLGLSCQAIADRLNIDKSLYSRYEKGERFPSGNRLCELADIFGVPIEKLVTLPLENTVIYPSGMLDELQTANKAFGKISPNMDVEIAYQNYRRLKSVLQKVLTYREDALDFPNLNLDLNQLSGVTIKSVTLDTRGEKLIAESIKIQMQLLEKWSGMSRSSTP